MTDILIVEDNPADKELALRVLKQNKKIKDIVKVCDGVEALNYLFSQHEVTLLPKIILLDLKLPKVNGIEVLKKIKEDDNLLLRKDAEESGPEEDTANEKADGAEGDAAES